MFWMCYSLTMAMRSKSYLLSLIFLISLAVVGPRAWADDVCCRMDGNCGVFGLDCDAGQAVFSMCVPRQPCSRTVGSNLGGSIAVPAYFQSCSSVCNGLAGAALALCNSGAIGGCPEGTTMSCVPDPGEGSAVGSSSGGLGLACWASCQCSCPRVRKFCSPGPEPTPEPTIGPRTPPPGPRSTPTPHFCPSNEQWCRTGPGGCCEANQVCLSTGCCDYDDWAPLDNTCCTSPNMNCAGRCCSGGDVCVGGDTCCPQNRVCGNNCCPEGASCSILQDADGTYSAQCGSPPSPTPTATAVATPTLAPPPTPTPIPTATSTPLPTPTVASPPPTLTPTPSCPAAQVCGSDCCATDEQCIQVLRDGRFFDECCPTERRCGSSCCPAGQSCSGGVCRGPTPTTTPTPTITPTDSPGGDGLGVRIRQ